MVLLSVLLPADAAELDQGVQLAPEACDLHPARSGARGMNERTGMAASRRSARAANPTADNLLRSHLRDPESFALR